MRKFSVGLFLIPMFLFVGNVLGCECIDPLKTPYQEFDNSSVVFNGRVIRFRDKVINEPNQLIERTFTFEVLEAFKGIKSRKEVDVSPGHTNDICYQGFQNGASYLVYAYKRNGVLTSDMCRRTFAGGINDVFYLRRKLKGEKEPRIYGRIFGSESPSKNQLKGIRIVAENAGHKFDASVKNGRFGFFDVPDGVYSVDLIAPSSIAVEGSYRIRLGSSEDYAVDPYAKTAVYLTFKIEKK